MILGLEAFSAELDRLAESDLREPTAKAIALVQKAAKNNAPVQSGELRESIYTQVEKMDGGYRATCYTNKDYAVYVEHGTGPRGQASHAGISPEVTPVYRQSPWWIHESQIDKTLAEKYHWFYIDTPDGRFYQCTGQPAQPFMYPALNENRENITEIYRDYLSGEIKK